MTRTIAMALGAVSAAFGQTTLRLRYGGPLSSYRITNISTGSPAVLTVVRLVDGQATHDFNNGDNIYVELVQGCQAANGYRKVGNSNQAAGTFALYETNGTTPVACGSTGGVANAFDTTAMSGYVGKVQTVTLNAHPRMFPRSGAVYQHAINDGSGKGGVVAENGPAWQGTLNRLAPYITPGCDGVTAALCTNEEARMGYQNVLEGWDVLGLALVWQADNTQTGYLNAAKYYLNQAHRLLYENTSGQPMPGFACDNTAAFCGAGSGADWISAAVIQFVKAYDIIEGQLNASEKAHFLNVILNGWNGSGCTNQLTRQAGTISVSGTAATGTGTSFTTAYSPGAWIYIKNSPPTWGGTGTWTTVSAISDDTHMTLSSSVRATNTDHYSVAPWDQNGSCGAFYVAGGHGAIAGGVEAVGATTLAAGINASQTTLSVANAVNFLDPPPFYIAVDSEIMLVTGINGNTLTVTRGQLYTNAASHITGAAHAVVWTRQPRGGTIGSGAGNPFSIAGEWRHNLNHQRAVGYLVAGLLLAGDDPRATEMAEQAWNYWYDLCFPWLADHWSGITHGGMSDWGYVWGRWPYLLLDVGIAGQYAFSNATYPEIFGNYFWAQVLQPVYWSNPDSNFSCGPAPCSSPDNHYYVKPNVFAWVALAGTFAPSTAAQQANYWFRNMAGVHSVSQYTGTRGERSAVYIIPYYNESLPAANFNTADPWTFNTAKDFDPDVYYGLMVSRSGWAGATDTLVIASLGMSEIADHTMDQSFAAKPGEYIIDKGSKLLIWPESYGDWFEAGTLKNQNYPTWWTGVYDGYGNQQNRMDRKKGSADYVYARGNFCSNRAASPIPACSWKDSSNILRSERHVLHLKGTPEYVVVFDDHLAGTAHEMRTRLHYYKPGDAGSTFDWSAASATATFVKPTGSAAMINSTVLFPDGGTPTITADTDSDTVTIDWGSKATAAQMFTVHRLAFGTSDVMPPVRLLTGIDTAHVGLEIDDGNSSRAVVFSKDGADVDSARFTTTFAGLGKCFIAGLAAGSYDVSRGGSVLLSAQTVASGEGVLYFDCAGGGAVEYVVQRAGSVALVLSPATLAFSATEGGSNPAPQTFQAACLGGGCTLSTSQSCGNWLTLTPSGGPWPAPQTFTVGADITGLAAGSYPCSVTVDAQGVASQPLTVTLQVNSGTPAPPLTILTTTLDNALAQVDYSFQLQADGGTGTRTWTLTDGTTLPDGLTLSTDGQISGQPTQLGTWTFGVQVTDSGDPPQSAETQLTLNVIGGVQFVTAGVTSSKSIVRYGRLGLRTEQTCQLVLSDTPGFTRILESATDTGGVSRRLYVFGDGTVLSPRTAYYARVSCGALTGTTQFMTKPAGPAVPRTVTISLHPPGTLAVDHATVEYGGGPQLGNTVEQPCSQGCLVQLTATSGTLLYVRHSFVDNTNRELAKSKVEVLAVP